MHRIAITVFAVAVASLFVACGDMDAEGVMVERSADGNALYPAGVPMADPPPRLCDPDARLPAEEERAVEICHCITRAGGERTCYSFDCAPCGEWGDTPDGAASGKEIVTNGCEQDYGELNVASGACWARSFAGAFN